MDVLFKDVKLGEKMKTKIYLIRSAECLGNIQNILGEKNNYEITEKGYKTIDILTEYFEDKMISSIYSGKSTMCLKTVEKIAENLNLNINKEEGLREKSFGIYDGKKWEDVLKEAPNLKKYRKKKIEILGIPEQESTKQVEDRMFKVIGKIARHNLGQTVLIVSHGVAIETFIRAVVGVPYSEDKEKYFQKNAAINILEYDEDVDEFEVKESAKIIYE